MFTNTKNFPYRFVFYVFISAIFSVFNSYSQCVIVSNATSPPCYGDANGQLLVEVSPLCGCQLPLYFRIQNSSTNQVIETTGPINSLSYLFENLPVGSYQVDACQDGSFTEFVSICASGGGSISSNPPLNVVASIEDILCNSQATGSIEISITSPNIGYPGPFNDPCRGWSVIWDGPTMPSAGIDLECPPEILVTGSTNTYQIENLLAGTYEVIVEDYNDCADTLVLEITEPPQLITMEELDSVCIEDEAFELTIANPTGGIYSGPGVSNNELNPSIAGLGIHTISYSYTDTNGCTNSESINIEIIECSLSLIETDKTTLEIYPNPTSGNVHIELNGSFTYELVDSRGRMIISGSSESSATINISHIESGVYLVKLKQNAKMYIGRIIKQ